MALRPKKPCAYPGCPALVSEGRYCQEHKQKEEQRYDKQRGTAAKRGYGSLWRKRRAQVLKEEPLCRECLKRGEVKPTKDVDHIIPKSKGGTDDRDNLQGLCHECHSRKTAKEDGGFGR